MYDNDDDDHDDDDADDDVEDDELNSWGSSLARSWRRNKHWNAPITAREHHHWDLRHRHLCHHRHH